MNTSLICEECGATLNYKCALFKMALKKKKLGGHDISDNRDLIKGMNLTRECCKKNVLSTMLDSSLYEHLTSIGKL